MPRLFPRSRRTPRAVTFLAVLSAACGDTRAESDPAFGAEFDVEALPRLVLVEEFRIGSVDDPDYGFSRIGSVDVDAAGLLYVFESLDRQIRVYSPDGHLLRRIGGPGQGPGEFGSSVTFGVWGDTVWATESSGRRLTLFDLEGRVLTSARIEDVSFTLHDASSSAIILPYAVGPDGLFVGDRGPTTVGSGEGGPLRDTVFVPRVRFDAAGRIVDTAGMYPIPLQPQTRFVDVGRSRYPVPNSFAELPLAVRLGDGRFVVERPSAPGAAGGVFRVTRLDLREDTVLTRTFRYRPVPYLPEALDSLAIRTAHVSGTMMMLTPSGVVMLERHAEDSAAARRAVRAAMDFPDFQPPIQSYHAGANGSLLLRREDREGAALVWILLDAELRPVGELDLRRGSRIVWSAADRLWAVENDDLGVPWLVRYRLDGPAESR